MRPVRQPSIQQVIDHTMAFNSRHAREGCGDDLHPEVTLAAAVISGMAGMEVALVNDFKVLGLYCFA